jgi:hypothetical protein
MRIVLFYKYAKGESARARERVLAEELEVLDAASPLWNAVRPLLDIALRLEQSDESYVWHGWNKEQISSFLKRLPPTCSLVVGVWEIVSVGNAMKVQEKCEEREECESLALGVVCGVVNGEVCSIRSFDGLTEFGLKAVEHLEPGVDDAVEIMRVVRTNVAPVAWALFTDKVTWDEWLFAGGDEGGIVDKGEILTSLARQGRCVILGSQTNHGHLA